MKRTLCPIYLSDYRKESTMSPVPQPQPKKDDDQKVEPVLPETDAAPPVKPDLDQPLSPEELDKLFGTDVQDTPQPEKKDDPEQNPNEVTLGKRRTWGAAIWRFILRMIRL